MLGTTNFRLVGVLAACVVLASEISWGGPTNDNFANRVLLSGTNISYSGLLNGATLEAGEPVSGDTNTVWISWAAPASGFVTTTLPHPAIYAWAVYTGPTVESLQPAPVVPLYFNSLCRFWASEGTVYHFQFSGPASSFTFNFQFQPEGDCTNDYFTNAAIAKGDGIYLGECSVTDATLELGEPAHWSVPHKSVWWKWQAPQNGIYIFNPNAALVTNLVLAAYSGETITALSLMAKSTNGEVRIPTTGGRSYYIAGAVPAESVGDIRGILQRAQIDNASRLVPGNLLLEPSWEGTAMEPVYWGMSGSVGGMHNGFNMGADGITWPTLSQGAKIWQDFIVTPGHQYELKFAFKKSGAQVKVTWDANLLGISTIPSAEPEWWNWQTYRFVPSNSAARVTFEHLGGSGSGTVDMDAFSVVDLRDPPSIVNHPASISTVSGGTVAFVVGARGTESLRYQWYFNSQPQPGQTNVSLVLNSVSTNQAGSYFAIVTNDFGAVTSQVAMLSVDSASQPTIVWQPYGDTVSVGGYYSFNVAAIGTQPLSYQWFFNGTSVSNANQKTLSLTYVDTTNAGLYQVLVTNVAGAVWSLPATLHVAATTGGGTIDFRNRFVTSITNELPVFDLDGITPLNGNEYLAQLYAGPALEMLRPAGQPTPFQIGFDAGYFVPQLVTLANVPPGSNCVAQVRAWEAAKGNSYEEARALGGKFGKSELLTVIAGGGPLPPQYLDGLASFSLQAGLPYLTSGILQFLEVQPDGTLVWALTGQPGYRYLIEKESPGSFWQPYLVLTNLAGTVNFTDASTNSSPVFYRARILD